MNEYCPISPNKICNHDEHCDNCLEFICVCDHCHKAGHTDSAGWYRLDDGAILCYECSH